MTRTDDTFRLIAFGFDVAPLLAQLEAWPHLWDEITARQTTPGSPHHDTKTIFLRGPREQTVHAVFNELGAIDYPPVEHLSEAVSVCAVIWDCFHIAELGRVMIVSLKPGGKIDRHFDEGAYAERYERYHLVLQSDPGNEFEVDDDIRYLRPGELWWFNHHKWHSVRNDSARERIHLIVDAVPRGEQ